MALSSSHTVIAIVFSFILLLVNATISLHVLPCERCLRNLQKRVSFLSPQMACDTEFNTPPKPDSVRNGLTFHQKYESVKNLHGYKYTEKRNLKSLVMLWRQRPTYIKKKCEGGKKKYLFAAI